MTSDDSYLLYLNYSVTSEVNYLSYLGYTVTSNRRCDTTEEIITSSKDLFTRIINNMKNINNTNRYNSFSVIYGLIFCTDAKLWAPNEEIMEEVIELQTWFFENNENIII